MLLPHRPLHSQYKRRQHGTQHSNGHQGPGVDGTAAPPGGGPSSRPGWPAGGPAPAPAEESDGRDGCRRPSLKATGASRLSRAEAHSATDPERLDLGPIFVQAVPLPSHPSEPLWGTAGRKALPTHWPLPRSPMGSLPLLTGAGVSLGLVTGVRGRWTQSPGSGLGFSSKHPCSLDPSVKGTRRSRPGWLRGLGGVGAASSRSLGGCGSRVDVGLGVGPLRTLQSLLPFPCYLAALPPLWWPGLPLRFLEVALEAPPLRPGHPWSGRGSGSPSWDQSALGQPPTAAHFPFLAPPMITVSPAWASHLQPFVLTPKLWQSRSLIRHELN